MQYKIETGNVYYISYIIYVYTMCYVAIVGYLFKFLLFFSFVSSSELLYNNKQTLVFMQFQKCLHFVCYSKKMSVLLTCVQCAVYCK